MSSLQGTVVRHREWLVSERRPLRLRVLLAAATVSLLASGGALYGAMSGGVSAGEPAARTGSHALTSRSLLSLPASPRIAASAALGADNAAYGVRASASALTAANPAQHLTSSFTATGVSLGSPGGASARLRLDGIGYGGPVSALAPVAPRVGPRANRVLYTRQAVSEWYANGPLGLEQGFTVAHAPAGAPSGDLTLRISLSSDARAVLARGGQSVSLSRAGKTLMSYGDLAATDAAGHSLRTWMTLSGGNVLLHVQAARASFPLRIDPLVKVTSFVPESLLCSLALAADGETVLLGDCTGSVIVMQRSEGVWQEQATITAAGDPAAISADGNTALVTKDGAVAVFTRSGSTWSQQATLTGAEFGDEKFGGATTLAGDGETALVNGGVVNGAGVTYVLQREGESWTQQAELKAEKPATGSEGENAIAISGDGNTALIGNSRFAAKIKKLGKVAGAAWVYTRSADTWTLEAKVIAGEKRATGFAGRVALSEDGSTAILSGLAPKGKKAKAGAAWVFARSGETWSKQSLLEESTEKFDGFGGALALSANGDAALIGVSFTASSFHESVVYLFTRAGESWSVKQEFGGVFAKEEEFGREVALSGEANVALITSFGMPHVNGEVVGVYEERP
jgi:hypothetical protein